MFNHRILTEAIGAAPAKNKVRLLLGARQTGKTELLRALVSPQRSAVFNLQDSALRRRFEQDPSRFGAQVRALPREIGEVVVDEIQKVPALLDEVQSLYDEDRTTRQFFLTGSSARQLRRGAANLLPGRSHLFHLFPVCRWEQADHDAFLDELGPISSRRPTKAPPFPDQSLARTLLYGSLPGVMVEPEPTAQATLSSYVELYLEEEIRREALARDLGAFGVFLRLAAAEAGTSINIAGLSRESGVAQSTLKNFFQVLEDTFVAHLVQPYGRAGRKRLLSTPRFLLFDSGVRVAAAEWPFEETLLDLKGGPLLEHWVGAELVVRASYLGRGHRVSFWRTVDDAEVDFVWESPDEDIPIEVKWTTRPTAHDARHVESFLDDYPKRASRGLVVCRCPAPERITDRVTAIPWNRL
jgi:predicted AAA+ superfamily ATPase